MAMQKQNATPWRLVPRGFSPSQLISDCFATKSILGSNKPHSGLRRRRSAWARRTPKFLCSVANFLGTISALGRLALPAGTCPYIEAGSAPTGLPDRFPPAAALLLWGTYLACGGFQGGSGCFLPTSYFG